MANKFDRAREESKARKASGGGGGTNFLKVPEDDEIQVRVLEDFDEINQQGGYFHRMPNGTGGRKYGFWEICLDQDEEGNMTGEDCPGCEAEADAEDGDYRRRLVFYVNVVWRNQPVRKKNKKGKWEDTDEVADQLALWEVSQETAQNALYDANLTYKSLTNRDFILRRRGDGYDTTYSLNVVTDDDGEPLKKALTKKDKELAEKKPDLSAKVAKKDLEEWGKVKEKREGKGGKGAPATDAEDSPFLNRNKKKDDSDDE